MNNNFSPKNIALDWLRYAEGDLNSAQILAVAENIPFRNVCYLAQQSVEKSLRQAIDIAKEIYELIATNFV